MTFYDPFGREGGYPPRVIWKKRRQSIENKENQGRKKGQESSRGGKRQGLKEIEEIEEVKDWRRGVWLRRDGVERLG